MSGDLTPIAVAVVEHAGRFLVGRRPAGVVLAGYWEFPGGKVCERESAEEAARRECLEETGVAVEVLHAYPSQLHQYDHGRVHLQFFACRPIDPHAEPRAPFRWVRREDLPLYRFPAGNQRLLESLTQS
jgi:8-oxo-dGTP diphosphatase